MAINPELITTIRVDQLADGVLGLDSLIPHTVGNELKRSTIQELVDLVATSIGSGSGVGFLPISVTDGQQLPNVPTDPSFFLAGAGTYLNINGFPNIICTQELNAIMSLNDHWQLAVEIPINATGGSGGATNLTYVASPTNGRVNSDTGTDAILPLATTTNAGLLSPTDKIKINKQFHVHTQTTPSTTWLITHNLERYPSIVIIGSDGEKYRGGEDHISINQVAINFSRAIAGTATLT